MGETGALASNFFVDQVEWLSTSKKPLEVFLSSGIKTGFVFPPEIAPGTSPYKPEGRKMPIACGANQTARKKMAQMTVKLFYYRLISNIHHKFLERLEAKVKNTP